MTELVRNSISFPVLIGLAGIIVFFASTVQLDSVPPVWWDEGWTLSIARNWVERGYFGRLSLGEVAAPGLIQGFPVIGLVALAFKYLGIGLFEARLVIVVYLASALFLLLYITYRFYNVRVAVIAFAVLLIMPGNRDMHPILMGRQILGEVPALFFLLATFVCLLWTGERARVFVGGAVLFGSLALITKAQVLPFWIMSMSAPMVITLCQREWSKAAMFATTLLGSLLLSSFWLYVFTQYLPAVSPVIGLTEVIGFVSDPLRRLVTFITMIQVGLPTLLSLIWTYEKLRAERAWSTHQGLVKISLFVLAGSWFAWWELASTGWPRYLFPAAFLASIFVSAMLYDWTDGFRFGATLRNLSSKTKLQRIRFAAAVFLIGWAFIQTTSDLADATIGKTNTTLMQTVDYLNNETPTSSIVETYESELFFFLKRRYHYPPDQLHVELIRREDLSEKPEIIYDPFVADPDYLVVGGWCRYYKCYNSVLSRDHFRLVKAFGSYEIFQRVR